MGKRDGFQYVEKGRGKENVTVNVADMRTVKQESRDFKNGSNEGKTKGVETTTQSPLSPHLVFVTTVCPHERE